MSNELQDELSYAELEERNLKRLSLVLIGKIREKRPKYLTDEKRIKAVTVMFSDLEGRLHITILFPRNW